MEQQMAPLPAHRVGGTEDSPTSPFSTTGVDAAGPFHTKHGRGKTRHRRFLLLFTCATYRAVHLEFVWSLDTDSILAAIERFLARRPRPKVIISDNASSFARANLELNAMWSHEVQESLRGRHPLIRWQFNPPRAPHTGGFFERLIGSAKRAMAAVLGNAELTDESLSTAIVLTESILNTRPLSAPSNFPTDDAPLTPMHFLGGRPWEGVALPVDASHSHFIKRWVHIRELVRQLWRRLLREVMPSLQAQSKWSQERYSLQVGDVVLMLTHTSPVGRWPLGRVTQILPNSTDNLVRVVEVTMAGKVYKRAVTQLVHVPTHPPTEL